MKTDWKKVACMVVSLSLLGNSMTIPQAFAAGDGSDGGELPVYEIYPTPHEISYEESEITFPETLPAVFGDQIDTYTRTRAAEALAEGGITPGAASAQADATLPADVYSTGDDTDLYTQTADTSAKKEAASGLSAEAAGAKLRVGVYGGNDEADLYFETKALADSALFEKNDAYQLVVNEDGIAVLGKNTDAAFYGLTTVKRIMQQVSDRTVRSLSVKDYSDVALRGFIEGYYGEPWSNEDRAELMKFGGELKMNIYFYAPKDDPKHRDHWRELYTEEELNKIKMLAQAGEESKCRYGYALHPFHVNPITFGSNYAKDLADVKAKYLQVINAGVRQIALLADDDGVPDGNPQHYVRLATDLTRWLEELEATGEYPGLKTSIPFCPHGYGENGSSAELKTIAAAPVEGGETGGLPNSVPIIMTGGAVWGRVSNSFLNTFYGNTGRAPFMWVNWPCSDNGKNLLVMGGYDTILNPGVDPSKIQGIMLNPMQQSEPSKVAIFGNADYAWNIWPDKEAADKALNDSFKYVDHVSYEETDTSSALRELSKHMIYENGYNPFPESVELKPKLDAFSAKLESGAPIAGDVDALKAEFQTLSDAANLYLASGQARLADQIQYWLKSWQDVTAADLALLDALKEIETGDGEGESNSRILSLYTDAQSRYEQSKSHGFSYIDHTEYALVGSQVIQPFTKQLLDKVAAAARQIMDPTIVIATPITSRKDQPEGGLDAMMDGNPTTEAVFKNPNTIANGEYVGVTYNRAVPIAAVRFLMGRNGNLGDTFTDCKLQYTENGTEWKDIPDASFTGTPDVLEKTGLDLNAMGVRAIATAAKPGTWLGVREIYINDLPAPEVPEESERLTGTPFKSDNVSIRGGALASIIDDDPASYVHLAEAPYNHGDKVPTDGAIGLNFGKAEPLGHILITQASGNDKMTNAVLEYSADGTAYTKIADVTGNVDIDVSAKNITAQYVRLRTLEYTAGWVQIFDFTVNKADTAPQQTLIRTSCWTPAQNTNENSLFDGDDNTFVWYDTGKTDGHNDDTIVGDYIGLDLGGEIAVGDVRFVVGAGDGDKWIKYDLQYSTDNKNWTTVKSITGNSTKDIVEVNMAGVKARYVRLVNQEYLKKWVKFSEISVKAYDPNSAVKEILCKSEDAQADYLSGTLTADTASLSAVSVTLEAGGYIGIALPSIREVAEITAAYAPADGLTLEAGCSREETEPISLPLDAAFNARYIWLRNTGDGPVTFVLNGLTVKSNETSAPAFAESNMGGAANGNDARHLGTTGNIFDGDVSTSCKFCATQVTDQYVLYDLGQTRSVSSLELFVRDSELDYVRNGKVQVAAERNGPWTDVINIESDVEQADMDTSALSAGWVNSSTYPNYVSKSGTISAQDARYVRVIFTGNFGDRWLVINELVVNGGEYIPEKNPLFVADPPEGNIGAAPSKLIDGDITTGFKPNMAGRTEGTLTYRLSDVTKIGQINILQSSGAISNAKVEVRTGADEWTEIGTLSKAFNSLYIPVAKQNVFDVRLSWGDVAPTFYELLLFEKGVIPLDSSRLQSLVDRSDDVSAEDEKKYDADVLAEYREALLAAQTLLGTLEQFTQQDVNDAYDRLTAAAEQLSENGDPAKSKEVLQGLLSDVAKDEQKYTPQSWEAYQSSEAYRQAQAALTSDDVTVVHAARAALTEEIKKLVLRADRAQLNQLLEQIAALQESEYTAKSYAAFQTEVARIRLAMADENLVQADADALLDELVAAKEKLERKPSGGHSSGSSNTTTTTTTKPDGTKETTTVNKTTGTTTVTSVTPDGVTAQTVTDKNGKTETTVTVPKDALPENGSVALPAPPADPEKAAPIKVTLPAGSGATVAIPLQNASNSTVAVLVGADGSEKIVPYAFAENGVMLVPLDASATLKIRDNGKVFTDVPESLWFAGAVQFVASRELFQGAGAAVFEPQAPMTRAMFATVLYRLAGSPEAGSSSFNDVGENKYYAGAVAWADKEGIVKGNGTNFEPDTVITREQLAAMLFRYSTENAHGYTHEEGNYVTFFIDANDISPWAADAVAWAVKNGILAGSNDQRLHPGDNATRAEVATMLQRFITTKAK